MARKDLLSGIAALVVLMIAVPFLVKSPPAQPMPVGMIGDSPAPRRVDSPGIPVTPTANSSPEAGANASGAKPDPTQKLTGGFLPDGELAIRTSPSATVLLDGKKQGMTPLRRRLRPGTHQVTLRHPHHGEVSFTVRIKPDKPTEISYRF